MTMTHRELWDWQHGEWAKELLGGQNRAEVDGVSFAIFSHSVSFRYKNATGLIHTTNGYCGERPDHKNYYPLVQLSCRYSDDGLFNPTVQPNIQAVATAVKKSWADFTQ